jgi:hypothetical protein
MNIRRTYRIDRATAEALLSGVPAARRDAGPLGALLAAAAASGRPEELADWPAAVAAFRAAHAQPATSRRGQSRTKIRLTKLFTVKVAAFAAAAATGGMALAATSGALPNPLEDKPAVRVSNGQGTDRPGIASPGSSRTGPSILPSASLFGLCTAYEAGADHGNALADPAFTALVTAAGGIDRVDGYCQSLLASSAANAGPPSEHPTGHSHPSGPRTTYPTRHPSGPPPSHPGH